MSEKLNSQFTQSKTETDSLVQQNDQNQDHYTKREDYRKIYIALCKELEKYKEVIKNSKRPAQVESSTKIEYQIKIFLFFLAVILPKVHQLEDSQGFLQALPSYQYGEDRPMLLRLLIDYQTPEKLLEKLDYGELDIMHNLLFEEEYLKTIPQEHLNKLVELVREIRAKKIPVQKTSDYW